MIDLFDLYREFNAMMNTSQNGFWRPETDFEVNVNVASIKLWNRLIDIAEREQRVIDDLRPFFKSKNIIVKNQNSFYGTITPPDDYGRYGSANILLAGDMCVPCKDVDDGKCINGEFKTQDELSDDYYNTVCERLIEKIENQRWASVLNHLKKRPTLDNPKMTQINNQFQVAPRQVSVAILNYYVKPKYATFKYTLTPANLQNGSGDVVIYNKTQSTPLEWPETVKDDLLAILKEDYIFFTRDSQSQQIASAQKQQPAA